MIYETDKDYRDCVNEQQFKMRFIKNELSKIHDDVFCIETEETVHGFPDVLAIGNKDGGLNIATFYEFKISNKIGRIKFQSTQPAFYRRHKNLGVIIVALNKKSGKVHTINDTSLFCETSLYRTNELGEVNLNTSEAVKCEHL